MSVDIELAVRGMLSEIKDGLDYSKTSLDTPLGDAGLDSLDIASLLLNVQEEFDLIITDDKADSLDTIGALVEFIRDHQAA